MLADLTICYRWRPDYIRSDTFVVTNIIPLTPMIVLNRKESILSFVGVLDMLNNFNAREFPDDTTILLGYMGK